MIYLGRNPVGITGMQAVSGSDPRVTALEAEIESLRQALFEIINSKTVTLEDGSKLTDEQGNPIEYDIPTGG